MATRTPKPKTADPDPAEIQAAATDPVEGGPVEGGDVEGGMPLKLKELIEAVVERTGQRKGEARTAVQAALAVMGEALAEGTEVNLPPLGKMKVNRTKPTPRGQMMMIKLVQNQRAPQAAEAAQEPLAETVQDV